MNAIEPQERKETPEEIITIRLPETEIAGHVKKRSRKGITVEMLRPYVGLTTRLPVSGLSKNTSPENKQVSAALLLLYKKALYFLKNKQEILKLRESLLCKMSESSFDKTRAKIIAKFEASQQELEKRFAAQQISGKKRKRAEAELRKNMIEALSKLYRAEHVLEEEIFGGILKMSDVTAFLDFFKLRNEEKSPSSEDSHHEGEQKQNDEDKE